MPGVRKAVEIDGGCELQHCSYAYQLQAKQKIVADAMQRLGRITTPVEPVIGMQTPWRYRNKGIFHAKILTVMALCDWVFMSRAAILCVPQAAALSVV